MGKFLKPETPFLLRTVDLGPTTSDYEDSGIATEVQQDHGTLMSSQQDSLPSALIRGLMGTRHMADKGLATGCNKNVYGLETEYMSRGVQKYHHGCAG
jgi:hypothetical protein